MICADGNAEARRARAASPPSRVTVWPRVAATATASSAVSRSMASHQWSSKLRTSSRRLRDRKLRSSADTRAECSPSIASTSRSKNRRRSEAAPRNSPSIDGRQPDHAQMIAERRGRRHRLAVDPAAPAGGGRLNARRIDAGAERREAERALDLGGHRPRAVALVIRDIVKGGAAQAASRRQKRDRLDAIGLAGAVRAHQHHHVTARLKARRAIIAEMREGKAMRSGRRS